MRRRIGMPRVAVAAALSCLMAAEASCAPNVLYGLGAGLSMIGPVAAGRSSDCDPYGAHCRGSGVRCPLTACRENLEGIMRCSEDGGEVERCLRRSNACRGTYWTPYRSCRVVSEDWRCRPGSDGEEPSCGP